MTWNASWSLSRIPVESGNRRTCRAFLGEIRRLELLASARTLVAGGNNRDGTLV